MKRLGAFCRTMPALWSRKTKDAEEPSRIGTSSAVMSTWRLSMPRPAQADIRCSTVCTLALPCAMVEASRVPAVQPDAYGAGQGLEAALLEHAAILVAIRRRRAARLPAPSALCEGQAHLGPGGDDFAPGRVVEPDAVARALLAGAALRLAGDLHGGKACAGRALAQPVDECRRLLREAGLRAQPGRIDQHRQHPVEHRAPGGGRGGRRGGGWRGCPGGRDGSAPSASG